MLSVQVANVPCAPQPAEDTPSGAVASRGQLDAGLGAAIRRGALRTTVLVVVATGGLFVLQQSQSQPAAVPEAHEAMALAEAQMRAMVGHPVSIDQMMARLGGLSR
jgi:hypothetical protein